MSNLNILGISGSLRAKSVNLAALKACGEVMPAGMSLKIAALDDLPMYNFDLQEKGWPAAVQLLRDAMAAADGVIFACPEFNWTISAPLKNAIDWLSRFPAGQQPFQNKPIALISATGGPLGGARVQYDARRVMGGLGGMVLGKPEVFIGMAQNKFVDGKLTDEPTRKFMTDQMVAFQDWIVRMQRAFA